MDQLEIFIYTPGHPRGNLIIHDYMYLKQISFQTYIVIIMDPSNRALESVRGYIYLIVKIHEYFAGFLSTYAVSIIILRIYELVNYWS